MNNVLKLKVGAVAAAFILITVAIGGALAWQPVDEGNVDVVTEWGDATGEVNTPGANWITPVQQDTVTLSTRQQAYAMSSKSQEGAKDYTDPVEVKTQDGVSVAFDVVVRYHLEGDKDDAVDVYTDYRTLENSEKKMIRPTVKGEFITTASSMKTSDIYTTKGQQELREVTREALQSEFAKTGLVLDTVEVVDYKLPDSYEEAVTEKEVAYQNELKAEAQVQVAQQEANAEIKRAEGQAESNRIVAESLKNNPGIIKIRYIEALKENENTVYVGAGNQAGITLTKDVNEDKNN